jgi:Glycosyl hydrolases family 43
MNSMKSLSRALAASVLVSIMVTVASAAALAPAGASSASTPTQGHVSVVASQTPAFAGDAPDPDIVDVNGTYYAFTTGTALGNHVQALVDTSGSPASGWRSYTGQSFGSSALPTTPSWETPNTQTSPGVFNYGGHWVMFYDASVNPNPGDSGHSCISVATASSLTPSSPVFTDTSGGPLLCGTGGVLDPSPFVDSNGTAYLLWKSNDGSSTEPSQIFSQRLDASGTALVGSPTVLLTVNPTENTLDDPQLVLVGGTYNLLFSVGDFQQPSYAQALATCSGPVGPCQQPSGPFLSSYGNVAGPGGGSLFTDASGQWWLGYAGWSSGCTNYSCGGARQLFTAPIDLTNDLNVPCNRPTGTPEGYRLTASDGGIFSFGNLPFCGSTGSIRLNQPMVGIADAPDGGGYWTVARDGGIFAFGDAPFLGSHGGSHLNQPIVGMAATPDGGGYWLVASDGGIFTYGDAGFYGSHGGAPLNQPIVGMAATPDGRGYWLVASDGGIFTYGDAGFFGSHGGSHLNQPIVGMATTHDGQGYWLVASDGGIFTYGDAGFFGSHGGAPLNKPIVGMAGTPDGKGYWLVASDGGIFTYGDAPFLGSTGSIHLNQPVVGMSGT